MGPRNVRDIKCSRDDIKAFIQKILLHSDNHSKVKVK